MLARLRVPVGWKEILKRTAWETYEDNCLGLAAQLAFYFLLALFPALLFLVSLISFFPIENVMDEILVRLAPFAPQEVLTIIRDQIREIAAGESGGLLTFAILGTIWSSSAAMNAIIDTVNRAYDIQDSRPFWKVRLLAIALTVALSLFIIVSFTLVVAGPSMAETIADRVGLGAAFEWTWKILQWPLVFALVVTAVGLVYYFAPDAEQDWVWITPGSLTATLLWLGASLGFKFYVANFGGYNETYGTIGAIIVLMMWFYLSGLALLIGAEMNAEIEHLSPYGKDPGEKVIADEKKVAAEEAAAVPAGVMTGAAASAPFAGANCDIDRPARLRPDSVRAKTTPARARASDMLIGGIAAVFETALVVLSRRRRRARS